MLRLALMLHWCCLLVGPGWGAGRAGPLAAGLAGPCAICPWWPDAQTPGGYGGLDNVKFGLDTPLIWRLAAQGESLTWSAELCHVPNPKPSFTVDAFSRITKQFDSNSAQARSRGRFQTWNRR